VVAVRRERRLWLELQLATEVRDRLREMPDRHRSNAGKGSLSRRVGRTEKAFDAEAPRAFGDGEDTTDPSQATVEGQLADGGGPLERTARHLLRSSEQRQRDRQVESGTLLAQLGRRKVDRDAARRKVQLGRGNPAADPLARLLAGAVGEPDDREAGNAVADVGFHVDAARLESDESVRDRACKHASRLGANACRVCAEPVQDRRLLRYCSACDWRHGQPSKTSPTAKQTAPVTAQKVLPVMDEPWMSVVPWPSQTTPGRTSKAPNTRLMMIT
jgi:hypothetical protein